MPAPLYRRSGSNYTIWHSGNDGSGSGLDADTLDGQHASGFISSVSTFGFGSACIETSVSSGSLVITNKSYIVGLAGGGSSAFNYLKLCTITINGSYQNRPIVIEYGGRSFSMTNTISIQFGNISGTDPDLTSFKIQGLSNDAWIVKDSTSNWSVYIHGREGGWADVFVHKFYNSNPTIAVSWTPNTRIESIPTGATQATWGGSVGYATNASSATSASNVPWSGVSSKPDTATRWPSWNEVTDRPSTFAPSSHNHDGTYLKLSGGNLSGPITLVASGNNIASFQSSASIGVVSLKGNGSYGTRLDVNSLDNTETVICLDYTGYITAKKFIKSGGTSTQLLKANGDTDNISSYLVSKGSSSQADANACTTMGSYWLGDGQGTNIPMTYAQVTTLNSGTNWGMTQFASYNSKLYFRTSNDSSINWNNWKQVAFVDSTVSAANSVPWSGITGKPDTYTPVSHYHDDRYLKLSGGSLTGALSLVSAGSTPLLFNNSGAGIIGISYGVNCLKIKNTDGDGNVIASSGMDLYLGSNEYKVLHSGNYTSYCAPASHTHSSLGGVALEEFFRRVLEIRGTDGHYIKLKRESQYSPTIFLISIYQWGHIANYILSANNTYADHSSMSLISSDGGSLSGFFKLYRQGNDLYLPLARDYTVRIFGERNEHITYTLSEVDQAPDGLVEAINEYYPGTKLTNSEIDNIIT